MTTQPSPTLTAAQHSRILPERTFAHMGKKDKNKDQKADKKKKKKTAPTLKTQPPKTGYKINDNSENLAPTPQLESDDYKGSEKLAGKVALITGADSGIGAAAAIAFAKEGARVAVLYYDSQKDAEAVAKRIRDIGTDAFTLQGDVGDETFAGKAVKKTVDKFGRLDILVNNAAEQHPTDSIMDITAEQLDRTFRTNIFGMFYFVKAALPHLPKGGRIINTTSVTAYRGSTHLLDYAATKGAIVAFTRSLATNGEVLEKDLRVNAVAPGPIWTPLIPASFGEEHGKTFGKDTAIGRPGQPYELAPAYVYLASEGSSYMTGQVLHINGGEIIGG